MHCKNCDLLQLRHSSRKTFVSRFFKYKSGIADTMKKAKEIYNVGVKYANLKEMIVF